VIRPGNGLTLAQHSTEEHVDSGAIDRQPPLGLDPESRIVNRPPTTGRVPRSSSWKSSGRWSRSTR